MMNTRQSARLSEAAGGQLEPDSLKIENDNLRRQNEELKSQLARLRKENKTLEAKNTELVKRIKRDQKIVESVQQVKTKLKHTDDLRSKYYHELKAHKEYFKENEVKASDCRYHKPTNRKSADSKSFLKFKNDLLGD